MLRVTCIFLICLCIHLVLAGPGTHRYDQAHSNYGDGKHNKEHVQEHINAMAKEGQEAPQLSEQDTIYYLFVVHDTNGDGYLDGHELRAAFSDYEDHNNSNGGGDQVPLIPLDEVTDMVDHVLEEDDKNGDGLISWSEYLESQLYHEK